MYYIKKKSMTSWLNHCYFKLDCNEQFLIFWESGIVSRGIQHWVLSTVVLKLWVRAWELVPIIWWMETKCSGFSNTVLNLNDWGSQRSSSNIIKCSHLLGLMRTSYAVPYINLCSILFISIFTQAFNYECHLQTLIKASLVLRHPCPLYWVSLLINIIGPGIHFRKEMSCKIHNALASGHYFCAFIYIVGVWCNSIWNFWPVL